MEVSVEDLARHFDATIIEANIHGRWSTLGHDIDLIGTVGAGDAILLRRFVLVGRASA